VRGIEVLERLDRARPIARADRGLEAHRRQAPPLAIDDRAVVTAAVAHALPRRYFTVCLSEASRAPVMPTAGAASPPAEPCVGRPLVVPADDSETVGAAQARTIASSPWPGCSEPVDVTLATSRLMNTLSRPTRMGRAMSRPSPTASSRTTNGNVAAVVSKPMRPAMLVAASMSPSARRAR
jgi:hypothetical protein